MTLPECEEAADLLRDYYVRSHRVVDRMMTAEGASFARARMLFCLSREGPLRSTDLATTFKYAPRTVTEAIDGMERDGLVRREPVPDDRRAKWITLTPAGTKAAANAEAARLRYVAEVFGVLNEDERVEMIRLLGKLNAQLRTLEG